MMRALWSASAGMIAQQTNMDSIANNLANVNTTGYKKTSMEFQDLLYANLRQPGAVSSNGAAIPTGFQVGMGVRPTAIQTDFQTGNLNQTGNPLDLAITSDAFFEIDMPDGSQAYTRSGSFKLDANGDIVTADGYKLAIDGGSTFASADNISIAPNGKITVDGSNKGTIVMKKFINPNGLEKKGQSLYVATAASGAAKDVDANKEQLAAGFLETSNVEAAEEMVKMITAQRAYELNSKAIQASDEMLQTANNIKR